MYCETSDISDDCDCVYILDKLDGYMTNNDIAIEFINKKARGNVAYETWYEMYTKPENAEKRAGWWGLEHIGKSGENIVVMLAQVSDEEKLTAHMTLVKEMAAKIGMQHTIYKLMSDSR